MKISPRDIDRFVADPPKVVRLFLVFGPDAGAVSERARRLEAVAIARDPAGGSIVRLGPEQLSGDPGRLVDEAHATPLFGGDPILRVEARDARINLKAALDPLLERPPERATIIVEAGDLAAGNALRKAFEGAAQAAALPCYADGPQDVAALARSMAAEAGLTIEGPALEALVAQLGGDRLETRAEIEKLILYVGRDGRISPEHVAAIVGENVEVRADQLIDAALLGRSEAVAADLMRLEAEGASAAGLLTQSLRQVMALGLLRAEVEAGKPASAAVAAARPPIFFKRRDDVEAALRLWPQQRLRQARALIQNAILRSRRRPELDHALLSDALLRISDMGRRLDRSPSRLT